MTDCCYRDVWNFQAIKYSLIVFASMCLPVHVMKLCIH